MPLLDTMLHLFLSLPFVFDQSLHHLQGLLEKSVFLSKNIEGSCLFMYTSIILLKPLILCYNADAI